MNDFTVLATILRFKKLSVAFVAVGSRIRQTYYSIFIDKKC